MSNGVHETDVSLAQMSDEGFLHRWSRRKQDVAEEQSVQDGAPLEPGTEFLQQADAEGALEEPLLTDADMPPIESLDEGSDYSGFMSPDVSDQLRNLALRKLFHIPVFNLRDGLDDYDDDYTSFVKLGNIITCDMKHMLEVEARKKAEKLLAEQEAEAQQDLATEELAESSAELPVEENESEQTAYEEDECCKEMDDVEAMGK